MRTCPHCGKQFEDNLTFCPVDFHPLRDDKIHWGDIDSEKTPESSTGILIKTAAASVAFVPMLVLILMSWIYHRNVHASSVTKTIYLSCAIFNFPAFSVLALIKTFNVSQSAYMASAVTLMFLWSSFLAWFFWRVARVLLGEDEPPASRGKYDWVAFQMRFVVGFIFGFLFGWRFVKYTTSIKTTLIACFVTGIFCGFLYGISRPPDFWSRS